MELFGETDTLLTRLSQRMETNGARMLRKSHILTDLSSDDETILSSLVKVTHVTTLFTKKQKQKQKQSQITFCLDSSKLICSTYSECPWKTETD